MNTEPKKLSQLEAFLLRFNVIDMKEVKPNVWEKKQPNFLQRLWKRMTKHEC